MLANLRKSIQLLFLALSFFACEKLVEVPPPSNQLDAATVFASEATAQALMNNLYSRAMGLSTDQLSPVVLGAYSADETEVYSTSSNQLQLAGNQLIPTNLYSTSLWSGSYTVIYLANVLIEGSEQAQTLSPAFRERIKGEALFFRAMAQVYLSSFYGRVPIVLSSDYAINTRLPQSDASAVLQQAITDLEQAAALLPADYAQSGGERIRLNTFAAKALLARVQLYAGNYEQAISSTSDVLAQTSLYGLGSLADAFAKNGREAIFQFRPNSLEFNTTEGNFFILTARPTNAAMRKSFFDGFEAGDGRRAQWTSKITVSGTDYYFPFKYKVKLSSTLSEHSSLLRTAELYLIRAEARARLDRPAEAIADLDILRSRAGLTKIATNNPTLSGQPLLDAILMERRSELFFEGAHRWIDLQRFGKSQAVLSPLKSGWKATCLRFPLPATEIQLNNKLVQNPGY